MLLMRARVDMTPTFYFSMNAGVAECDMTPLPQDDSKTGVSMSGARRHDVAGGIQLHKGAPRTWLNSRTTEALLIAAHRAGTHREVIEENLAGGRLASGDQPKAYLSDTRNGLRVGNG